MSICMLAVAVFFSLIPGSLAKQHALLCAKHTGGIHIQVPACVCIHCPSLRPVPATAAPAQPLRSLHPGRVQSPTAQHQDMLPQSRSATGGREPQHERAHPSDRRHKGY